jgi:hypothetical protein
VRAADPSPHLEPKPSAHPDPRIGRVDGDEQEVPLQGGLTNAGKVVRKGETVRRPARPTSPATQALLRHLEGAGFAGAPRFLRIDKRGREVHTYIHGEAAIAPLPGWALTDEALVSVAELLRSFHDAQAGFDPSPHQWPLAAPSRFGHAVISHNDPCPDNVVFRDGRAVALIDFDLASPGSRRWDVACAARLWAPLVDPLDGPDIRHGRALERMRLFLDAYGLPARERSEFAEVVLVAYQWCYDLVRRQVDRGHPSFVPYWNGGGGARVERGQAWLEEHRAAIDAAATG